VSPGKLSRVIQRLREGKKVRGKKMTQRDLANRAQVTAGYIAQLELGIRTPSLAVLKRIAKALGVPVGELLE
jgi:transcriptional regulator with XRE-family HTH domain